MTQLAFGKWRNQSRCMSWFDKNRIDEQVIAPITGGKEHPMAPSSLFDNATAQLWKKNTWSMKVIKIRRSRIFYRRTIGRMPFRLEAFDLSSCVAINDGKGKFTLKPLPVDAQLSPMYGVMVDILTGMPTSTWWWVVTSTGWNRR